VWFYRILDFLVISSFICKSVFVMRPDLIVLTIDSKMLQSLEDVLLLFLSGIDDIPSLIRVRLWRIF